MGRLKTIAESIWGGIGTSVGAVWETIKAPAAALAVNAPQTMARQNSASFMPNFNSAHLAGAARQPGSVLGGSATGGSATGGSATGVSANFSFSVNGVPDADFARRVIDALKSRKQEFEHLLGSVVNDQRRLALW